MSKKITKDDLQSIVLREYRKKQNKELNEGMIGDLLGKISDFLQSMTKSVANNTKEATQKTLRASKEAFEASNLTKDGMKDMAGGYKKALDSVQNIYKTSYEEIVGILSQSADEDIQKNVKGYASNIMMTCMADVASVVEGKSDINDLINALQSGGIDTKNSSKAEPGETTGETQGENKVN